MKEETFQTPFSQALLTSVFVGFITCIICLVFNIVYRDTTGFHYGNSINVSTLIFGINLLFVIIGLIYFIFMNSSKKAEIIYIVLFIALTAFCVLKAESIINPQNEEEALHLRGLLLGLIIISGVGSLIIPLLFHNKRFRDAVL